MNTKEKATDLDEGATLGSLLKQERKLRGMTKKEMAEFLNLSQAYIGQLESGEKIPTLTTLDKIGLKLQIPVGLLMLSSVNQNDLTPLKKEDFGTIMGVVRMALEKRYL